MPRAPATTWQRLRPWVEDLFAAACWVSLFVGGTLFLVGVGA